MKAESRIRQRIATVVLAMGLMAGPAVAQAPGEVQNLAVSDTGDLSWNAVAGADFYNSYRTVFSTPQGGLTSLSCHDHAISATTLPTTDGPGPGAVHGYLISAESSAGEGTVGNGSGFALRWREGKCGPFSRAMVLSRTGFGWSEWDRDRIDALGSLDAYIAEQINPASISEADNFILHSKLSLLDPPADVTELIGRDVIYAIYARRQLEAKMAMFWVNHFNTWWQKVSTNYLELYPDCAVEAVSQCDPVYPVRGRREGTAMQRRDFETFRDLTFNGNFRQMLEAGSMSVAMLIYLDLQTSDAVIPNENQPRELLELHAMGVDGGYLQADVEELSRVMTGFEICKKPTADVGDLLADTCINDYWEASPAGDWSSHFNIDRHDCGAKTLFAATPYELNLPGTTTCSGPADAAAAVAEFHLALDTIVSHPSTARFISKKILQLLVTDEPTTAMVDQLVAVWDNPGNPNGVGDLREVTREALSLLDTTLLGSKLKTPFEQLVGGLRSLRGVTDGVSVILAFLGESQHLPYLNEVPTGYSELGGDWVNTGAVLARQNWSYALATAFVQPSFGSQPLEVMMDNGVNTGSSIAIIQFMADILFGGNLTFAERQTALNFINTADDGGPGILIESQIRKAVALLLGFPQFQEQ